MISDEETNWIERAIRSSGGCILEIQKQTETVLGAVYKVVTSNGLLYFKTGFGREAEITAELYNVYPAILPRVVDFEVSRNWLLSIDGGASLSETSSIQIWLKSIQTLGSFHRDSKTGNVHSGDTSQLLIENVFQLFESYITDADCLEYWEIEKKIEKRISVALSEIRNSIYTVDSLGLGVCTCHGDAQPMNSLAGEGGCLWFDWRESHQANPAIDIGWFLSWLMPFREYLHISVSEKLLYEFRDHYFEGIGVSKKTVSIYSLMQYALIYRIVYFHNQFFRKQYGKPYVEYHTRLLNRVLERRIG